MNVDNQNTVYVIISNKNMKRKNGFSENKVTILKSEDNNNWF